MGPGLAPIDLPGQMAGLVAGYSWRRTTVGRSGAEVFFLWRPGVPGLYLKTETRGPSGDSLLGEAERLRWISDKLPVPRVVAFAEDREREYLLLSQVPGLDASHLSHRSDAPALVRLLAQGLRMLHAVPVEGCPFDSTLDMLIAAASQRVARGLVDEQDFDPERQGRRAGDLLRELLATRPREEDLVFTHGDYCLPNVVVHQGRISGFVDLGRAGVSDRYRDLALAARSLAYNVGQEWVPTLFAQYGIPRPDWRKVEFYKLLDEFF